MHSDWNWDIVRRVKAHDNVGIGGIFEALLWAVAQLLEDANMCSAWVQTHIWWRSIPEVERDSIRAICGHWSITSIRKKKKKSSRGLLRTFICHFILWLERRFPLFELLLQNLLLCRYSNHFEMLSWKKHRWSRLCFPVISGEVTGFPGVEEKWNTALSKHIILSILMSSNEHEWCVPIPVPPIVQIFEVTFFY